MVGEMKWLAKLPLQKESVVGEMKFAYHFGKRVCGG